MGMFDLVIADFECPYCGFKLTKEYMEKSLKNNGDTWQTKATSCSLETYKIGDKLEFEDLKVNTGWMEIHDVCQNCDTFVEAEIKIKNGRLGNSVRYKQMS